MLDFALEVHDSPHSVTAERIEELRQVGLSDTEVLHVVHIVGFFAYYNRMVDALGVRPEEWMQEPDSQG